jgi:2-polyprenyl-3-methyl-5-hydroxy-6-metoxy-1,4-benzoquinol methylase
MTDWRLITHPDGWRTVEPKPTPEALRDFYAREYYQGSHGTYAPAYSDQEVAHRKLLARQMLHAISQTGAPKGSLLDVGCGEGWLMAAAKDAGWTVRGIDFSSDGLARFHPELAPNAQFGDAFALLDALAADGTQVAACAMEHVLEHVLDPEALLDRLRGLLAPGGVLAVTVPNDFSPLQLAARETGLIDRDFWVAPPQHLNYFNADNLPRLLMRMGYEVRLGFASFPIDWFLMHEGSNYVRDPAAGKPTHRARLAIDLMLAERGMDAFLGLAKALYACGAGRSLTVIAAPRGAAR